MATATERLDGLTAAITANNDKLDKAKAEIVAAAEAIATEVANLRDQVTNGTVTLESLAAAEAAVASLQEKAQGLDDLNVDAENPGSGTEPEPGTPATDAFGNLV